MKPLLNVVRVEDELKAKDEEISELKDKLEKEEKLRKDYEGKCVTLLSEKNDLSLQLQAVGDKRSERELGGHIATLKNGSWLKLFGLCNQ